MPDDIYFGRNKHEKIPQDDIYFGRDKQKRTPTQDNVFTQTGGTYTPEKIEDELLSHVPVRTPYHPIDMEDDFARSAEYRAVTHELSDKERAKRKKKRIKEAQRQQRSAKRKKSGASKFIKRAICLVLVVAIVFVGACAYAVSGYTPTELKQNEYTDEASLISSPKVFNLLMMGIDTENTGDSSRSDSMILMSADIKNRTVKFTSFMRDMYVDIPDHWGAKLNAACTYGGPQLVCDTVECTFGIRIDGYIKIGYEVLTALVDGIGGITIPEVDEVEAAALAEEGYNAPVGENIKMNGFEVLQYCRIRHGQDDFYRTARQREVIGILTKKLLRTNPVKLVTLSRRTLQMTECSVSQPRLFVLFMQILPCLTGDMQSARIPIDGSWYDDYRNGQAVLIIDTDENTEYLEKFIYGKDNNVL